ncbi:MAG TPA: response regulator [Candidatus Limnocylindria bacterium]|nr:response regulator [Candidatus Limnocylindria bacterium]
MIAWAGDEPVRGIPETAGPAEAARGGRGRRRPVLVVDDDRSILETVSQILRADGYDVLRATSGREALAHLDRVEPSAVLLDMRMPDVDGWAVARAIAARGRRVPVIVMTAAANARHWAEEIDATAFLAKPFDIDELLTVVERHTRPLA